MEFPDLLVGQSVKLIFGLSFVLLLITIVLFSIIRFRSNNHSSKGKTEIMIKIDVVLATFTSILVAVGLVIIVGFSVVRGQEQEKLFQPEATEKYKHLGGDLFRLKSGGAIMNLNPNAPGRPLYFIHGNSLNLDYYAKPLYGLVQMGYNVWAIEFSGYGMATDKGLKPSGHTVLRDSIEGYDFMISKTKANQLKPIVIGFSLGGAILGEIYETLTPEPAQLGFLNTFCNMTDLVADKLPVVGDILKPCLKTKWKTKSPKFYQGQVLIVTTKDDTVVPPAQGRQLCKIFSKVNPECVEIANGGHRKSCLIHQDQWITKLLPPSS